jgi:hypothetical protein
VLNVLTISKFILHWYLRHVWRQWRECNYNLEWTVRGHCSSIYRQSYSFVWYYIHTLKDYIQGLQMSQGQYCHLHLIAWATPSPYVAFLLRRDEACFVLPPLLYVEAFLVMKLLWYLIICWKQMVSHVFEDLQKTKAPNTNMNRHW